MFKSNKMLFLVLISVLLTSTCGTAETVQAPPAPATEAIQNTPVPTATDEVVPDTPTPAPTKDKGYEAVTFITSDDITISGRLFGEGEKAVILAHNGGCGPDQKDYESFAVELASQGFTVLSFDFRGRGRSGYGLYECYYQDTLLLQDLYAAVEYLQDLGHGDIACIGGSIGAWACLAGGMEVEFFGIVALSGNIGPPSFMLTEENLPLIKGRKLFVAFEGRETVVEWLQFFYDHATEPKELVIFSGNAIGTEFLLGIHAKEISEMIFDFLAEE